MELLFYTFGVNAEASPTRVRRFSTLRPVKEVRRAICRLLSWPSSEGKMVRMSDTLRLLRENGATKVKIIGEPQTLDLELEKDGKCKQAP